MVEISVRESLALDDPVLVDGLPGVGLVGKIAADHLVNELDMRYYAAVDGEELPQVAVFDDGAVGVKPPVRLFADEGTDLLVLRSDVPVSALDAPAFAADITAWAAEEGVLPVYLCGLPTNREPDAVPSAYGIATGGADSQLARTDVEPPETTGMVSGPSGALLSQARAQSLDAVGFVVETDPRFPDPQGARILVEEAVAPIADIDVDTDPLVEGAESIMERRETLARRMQEAADHESSQASSVGMYH